MKKKNFHFPEKIINELADKFIGLIDEKSFEQIINILDAESSKYLFDSVAQGNFYRVINSIFDISTFLKELINFPHHAEILFALTSSSNYLTDIIVQNPEFLYQVFDDDYLKKILTKNELEIELISSISKFKNFETKIKLIRQFKKRYILKIGLQDILHLTDLKIITLQLSILAKVIISALFDLCFNEIVKKYNIKKITNKFSICALGKLGGNELNYSSDVDLIIFYDKNTLFKNCNKDYHEILTESIQLFTNVATQISSHGFIYRIDFRLRPDGKYSPLCKAMHDYIKYYETRGEDWEKQMLVKLSFVSGDLDLYNKFNSFVDSYVYHSMIKDSIKEKIKKMKLNIEKNNFIDDIKAFEGGIRDIEFSVQALQLLNGYKFPQLKTGNTLQALEVLYQKNFLNQKEFNVFTESYIFYRKIEHFLQLMNDTQTHKLPDDYETKLRLANYLKIKSIEKLTFIIESKRKKVRKIYNSILSSDKENIFSKINFLNKTKAEKNLTYLKTGKEIIGRKEFDSLTISSFEKIEYHLYKYLQRSLAPDIVLENFTKVIHFVRYPSIWFNEFRDEKFFALFLRVCEFSEKAINLLINSKKCGEIFLSKKFLIKNYEAEFSNFSSQELIFLLAVQYSLKLINAKKISEVLYEYISCKIIDEFDQRFKNEDIFIAALGSMGSKSMSFSSDIDLIVVIGKIDVEKNIEKVFQNFNEVIKNKLKPFEVDFRLRPEGKKAQLVWDIEHYKNYLNNRAKVWEFQSFSKIDFIAGNKHLYNQFTELLQKSKNRFMDDEIKNEVKRMHSSMIKQANEKNLKNILGGITTIEFIFQFILLTNSEVDLFKKNYFSLIKMLSVKDKYIKQLLVNFKRLKVIELTIQNIFDIKNSLSITNEQRKKYVAKFLNYKNEINFEEELRKKINENITLFNKYLN